MEGLKKSIELAADMREKCGDEFLLMWDCWMALDLQYAKRLMQASADLKFNWIEECFNPDDYWSYRDLKKAAGPYTSGIFPPTNPIFLARSGLGPVA